MADIYESTAGRQAIEARYRHVLSRWPVALDEITVPTRQGSTFVIASGDRRAPAVFLFHGSGTNSGIWLRDVAEWSRSFRVFAVDLIGEPGFSAASRPPLESDAYARWLDDVWDYLGVENAALVGVSLGGWLALDYAVRRPNRVAALSMLSPSGIGRQNPSVLLKVGLLRLCGEWGMRRAIRMVAGRTGALPPQTLEFLGIMFRTFRPRLEKIPIKSDEDLKQLTLPVQLIVGAQDVLLRSRETRDRTLQLVPQAQVVFLEQAGHILPPQTQAVSDFLRAVLSRDAEAPACA
jgi:pimeloyl-ACP methyl ester carboxylesterase